MESCAAVEAVLDVVDSKAHGGQNQDQDEDDDEDDEIARHCGGLSDSVPCWWVQRFVSGIEGLNEADEFLTDVTLWRVDKCTQSIETVCRRVQSDFEFSRSMYKVCSQ